MSGMRDELAFFILTLAFTAGTVALGWWMVPVVAGVWGVLKVVDGPVVPAAGCAAVSWTLLLLWTRMQGPVGALTRQVAGAFGLPGFALFVLAVVFAAVLAAAAAGLGAAVREGFRSGTGAR